jgi:hypothetical protein
MPICQLIKVEKLSQLCMMSSQVENSVVVKLR